MEEIISKMIEYLNILVDKKLDEALKENETLEKELVNAEIKVELAEGQLTDEKEEVEKIAKILDSIKDKGRSPPCWFRLVSDTKSGHSC